jgi:hypothetical protein
MDQQRLPEQIRVAAPHQLALKVHARGVQVYRAVQSGNGGMEWTLVGPEAELLDDEGRVIGTHFEGPAWRHDDGSEVRGKAIARVESPDSQAIPWLLLQVISATGTGAMGGVSLIQRIDTGGGGAPDGSARLGTLVRVPYTAVYCFYNPA